MKILTCLALSLITLPALGQVGLRSIGGSQAGVNYSGAPSPAPEPKIQERTFYVSEVGQRGAVETRDKLLELFADVQSYYTTDKTGAIIVKPSLENADFMDIQVTQVVSPTLFICDDFALKTIASHKDWVDNQDCGILWVVATDPYSYITVLGAKRTIKCYQEVGAEPGPTQTQFLNWLKQGKKLTAYAIEEQTSKLLSYDVMSNKVLKQTVIVKYTMIWK